MSGELLIDNQGFFSFRLEEAAGGGDGKIIMRGQFARSDKATENKRLYRESLWKREFGRLSEAMGHRRMFGELDHPSDGRTKLQRVSHLVTSLRIEGNEVVGEAEVLDTPNGRILKTLAKANAQVGVSSRGYGSTKTLADGTQEVQEDFKLDTFDFVADPATRTAYPKVFAEEREHIREAELEGPMSIDTLKRNYPGLVEELSSEVRRTGLTARDLTEAEERAEQRMAERFSVQLRRTVELTEENLRAEIRSDLMSDPKVAGALSVVEQIVGLVKSYGIDPQAADELMVRDEKNANLQKTIEDKTLEIHKLTQQQEQNSVIIRQLAYKLHLEHLLAKDPARDAIETLLGDVMKIESKDEITKRVEAIRSELDRRGGPNTKPAETVASDALRRAEEQVTQLQTKLSEAEIEVARLKGTNAEVQSEVTRARTAAEQAISVAESLEIRLHAAKKISESNLEPSDRSKLNVLCEAAISVSAVDEIIEGFEPRRTPDGDEASRIRDRVRRGKSHDRLEEEHGSVNQGGAVRGAGNTKVGSFLEEVGGPNQHEFDRLAGTGVGRA